MCYNAVCFPHKLRRARPFFSFPLRLPPRFSHFGTTFCTLSCACLLSRAKEQSASPSFSITSALFAKTPGGVPTAPPQSLKFYMNLRLSAPAPRYFLTCSHHYLLLLNSSLSGASHV